jgi:hypothetical protein
MRELRETFAAALPACCSDRNRVERYFARTFVQEHMRMAEQTHAPWGVELRSPFLDEEMVARGIRLEEESPSPRGSKALLRRLLRDFRSAAADRIGKEQMALSPSLFRETFRDELLREFQSEERRVGVLDYEGLTRLASSDAPISKGEARLLWVVYNLHLWFAATGAEPPPLA